MAYNPFSTSNITSVEHLKDGSWFYNLFNSNSLTKYTSDLEKLNTVLFNPAFLTVAKYQCDMFSLGRIKAMRNGKELPNDQLVNLLKYPNPFQTDKQYLWDYMFWLMLGTAYSYTSSKLIKDNTNLYWLNPSCLVWDDKLCRKLDKIALSKGTVKDIEKLTIKYNNADGTQTTYSLGEIKPFFDLTNGLGNWYRGSSTVDALYKILSNSDASLDSKHSNLDFAGKFIVSGQNSMENIHETPMGNEESTDAKQKLKGKENVHVLKTPINIDRFVDNIDNLKLDKAYNEDVFKVAKLYNHPKAVIESLENTGVFGEEKKEAKADFVDEVLKPKGEDLMNGLETIFGYDDKNIDLVISYDHLSFMQVRNKQRQESISREINNIRMAVEFNVMTEEDAAERVKTLMDNE